jgi:Uma2 family endonuclease
MKRLESLIEPLRHSPLLPEVVTELKRQIEVERERRARFYREMSPEQKIEFIDGAVILHSPARNRHLDVTKYVLKLLDTYASLYGIGSVKTEKCLCVFPRNDYEPDVVFFGRTKSAQLSADTLKFPVPDLIVEVLSESTEERDRGVKFEDYAANGVGEYWIVNTDQSTIEQYVLRDEDYELRLKSSTGRLHSEVIDGFDCDVESLFDEQKNLAQLRRLMSAQ